MEFKLSAIVVVVLASLARADDPASNLPVLYRVDQPTSNVVVFRGANVALAQAAGLIRSPILLSAGNAATYVAPQPPPPPTTTTTTTPPPTTTTLPPTTTPTPTTTPPPPPPPPTTTAAPAYIPPPVPTQLPVVIRSPLPSYGPAPVVYTEPEPAGPANYNWQYAVVDDKFNDFGHKETRDGYQAIGKYYVNLPDGRTQVVTYTADATGYTPVVEYTGVAQYPEEVKPTYNY